MAATGSDPDKLIVDDPIGVLCLGPFRLKKGDAELINNSIISFVRGLLIIERVKANTKSIDKRSATLQSRSMDEMENLPMDIL